MKGYISALALCYNVVLRDFDCLFISQNTTSFHRTLSHYIDDIMLVGPDEQDVATILNTMVGCMHARGWELNPTEFQGQSSLVNFLGIWKSRAY